MARIIKVPLKPARRNWPILVAGLLFVVLGVTGLALKRVVIPERQEIINGGPDRPTIEVRRVIEFPPILCGLTISGGLLLVFLGGRKQT